MATRLSVNINKIATLRNARGGNNPDVVKAAIDCVRFGAEGITVHPRPDERHIRRVDVLDIAGSINVEFNIEGYPDSRYLQIIRDVKPTQATLVPDAPDAITSNQGWQIRKNEEMLKKIIADIKGTGTRVSLFIDPIEDQVAAASAIGADRVELFTEPYAKAYLKNKEEAVDPYIRCAKLAKELNLGINAGHDLDLENLRFLKTSIPWLDEVSIGHALISDALYFGLENAIQLYRRQLRD